MNFQLLNFRWIGVEKPPASSCFRKHIQLFNFWKGIHLVPRYILKTRQSFIAGVPKSSVWESLGGKSSGEHTSTRDLLNLWVFWVASAVVGGFYCWTELLITFFNDSFNFESCYSLDIDLKTDFYAFETSFHVWEAPHERPVHALCRENILILVLALE